MREIKFRAWDKRFNILLEPDTFNRYEVWISGDGKVYEIEEWSNYGGGGKHEIDCTEQYILMQYTGLNDRNGKEIYEGDIVTFPDCSFYDGKDFLNIGVFEWDNVNAGFNVTKRSTVPMEDFFGSMDKVEVIGNVFENGELLNDR